MVNTIDNIIEFELSNTPNPIFGIPDILIKINGRKAELLILQMDQNQLKELGAFPQQDTNIIKRHDYSLEILKYTERLYIAGRKAQLRTAQDILYSKINKMISELSDEPTEKDVEDMVKEFMCIVRTVRC